MKEYEEKCIALRTSIEQLAAKDMVVAFSGGADSSLLLKLACEAAGRNGRKVYAVTVHTRLHPAGDLEAAERTARETGAIHRILFADELELREKQGVNQGICQEKEQMASLLLKLISAGRSSEVERALREPEYYDKLAKELGV